MQKHLISLVMAGLFIPALFAHAQHVNTVPIKYTSSSSGREMYTSYCAACHGSEGKGNGPAAKSLAVAPTNLSSLARMNGGKFPSQHVVSVLKFGSSVPAHGSAGMPIWGPLFNSLPGSTTSTEQQRISNLTRYLETMQVR
jgi:mono/diheme cytochrome c family protein